MQKHIGERRTQTSLKIELPLTTQDFIFDNKAVSIFSKLRDTTFHL